MILGKWNKHFHILWRYVDQYRTMILASKRVVSALRWYDKQDITDDYGYVGDWREHLEYCCDRMNGGRARAILRLIGENHE